MTTIEAIIGMTDGERVLFRLRTLHRERVAAIHQDNAQAPLNDPSRLIVHLMPEKAAVESKEFSATDLKRAAENVQPLGSRNGGCGDSRFNSDGLLFFSGRDVVRGYSQMYRNGVYEGVMAEAVFQPREQGKTLRESRCEDAMLIATAGYLHFAKTLGLEPPFWMFAAMVGCEGAKICLERTWEVFSENAIDRSVVWLPNVKVESFEIDAEKALRPVFDVLWNSAGLERSFNYDEHGTRKQRRETQY